MKLTFALLLVTTTALADPLPNLTLTPGVARSDLTTAQVCMTKWGKDTRAVTEAMKQQVFKFYGFSILNHDPRCPCEIDHLISRELGGADDVRNLWPQSYSGPWNAHMKDRLENRLHKEVCEGKLPLAAAQQSIVADWTSLWKIYFGGAGVAK
jgi:hypothetical protein